MRNFLFFLVSFVIVSLSVSLAFMSPSFVFAETHITGETVFQGDTLWNKEGSPYILDDSISIPSGQSLSIGPGVTVEASSTADNPISIFIAGDLTAAGTASDTICISGLDSMTFSRANVSLSHTDISLPDGIAIFYSTTTIASSTIHDSANDSAKAINLWASTLQVEDSSIDGNDYGIYSYYVSPGPFLSMLGKFISSQTVLADVTDDPRQNHISISGSDIVGNTAYGLYNATPNIIHAENNWWGNSSGPNLLTSGTSTKDDTYGPVDDVPWLTKDPLDPPPSVLPAVCCSNVLFLPGIEASRLYGAHSGQTPTDKLWEPLHNSDVQSLFLTDTGESVNPSVYADGIINSAYGFGIYDNFITMMNGLVADGMINTWKPFAYDWRLGIDTLADATTSKLLDAFQALASSSKTGKVSIVAHSNGGLLAKMLAKTLADTGKAGLIDKMVMVAVPELGTPQAVAGLLHGDNEDILNGLILGKNIARELGDNAPGAYGLLPSKDYFTVAGDLLPIISFATSTLTDFHFNSYGDSISTYDSLHAFLAGIADHRQSPAVNDIASPDILHAGMLDEAQNIHDILDTFPPALPMSSSTLVSLIGVGVDTLTSLHYFEKINCPSANSFIGIFHQEPCTDSLMHTASTTLFGDGTVVDVSAEGLADTSDASAANDKKDKNKKYYFNLFADNKGKIMPDSHATLLNSNSGVAFVRGQVTDSSSALPPYITTSEPTLADFGEDNLVVTMHSPVDVNIYDSQGRHTGPIPSPNLTSDLGRYEENIPDSIYDPEATDGTTVTVPYSTDYKVILNGTGSGSFTLDTEREQNGVSVAASEFANMPATPLLKAELILATTTYSSATSSATTSQLLVMDFDGDGSIDATSTPGADIDPTAYLRSVERTIKSLGLNAYRQKIMCDKIDKIIAYILAKKPIRVNEKAATLAGQALSDIRNQHWIFKNLDQEKKDRLTTMFQSILDSVDI